MLCNTSSFFLFFSGCAHLLVVQICQRLLSLSTLTKSMDFKAIFGEVPTPSNGVGMRCMSHLFNNAGDQVESKETDNFAGAFLTAPTLRISGGLQLTPCLRKPLPTVGLRSSSDQFVTVWKHMKKFVDVYSTSNETRSAKAKLCWEELARMGKDGYHQELWLQLVFALAVYLGVHLPRATYLLDGDGMLVSYCVYSFLRPVPPFFLFL